MLHTADVLAWNIGDATLATDGRRPRGRPPHPWDDRSVARHAPAFGDWKRDDRRRQREAVLYATVRQRRHALDDDDERVAAHHVPAPVLYDSRVGHARSDDRPEVVFSLREQDTLATFRFPADLDVENEVEHSCTENGEPALFNATKLDSWYKVIVTDSHGLTTKKNRRILMRHSKRGIFAMGVACCLDMPRHGRWVQTIALILFLLSEPAASYSRLRPDGVARAISGTQSKSWR